MTLTAGELNRATLARQLLLARQPLDAVEAVRQVTALQAQQPASPYLALWNRVDGFDAAELDAAFVERRVVKASLLRLTLHAVHADDYPHFHNAMVPSLRASRLADGRYTSTGLSIADADAFMPELLDHLAVPRTRKEIEELIEERFGTSHPRLWWALKTFAPLHLAPTGGSWSFDGSPTYVAAGTEPDQTTHELSVQHLVLRYLQAFGPASVPDIAQATLLRRPVITRAVEGLGGQVEGLAGPGGTVFDVPDGPRPAEDTPAPPRLLPMWDSTLLAYADRSRIIPPEHRPVVTRRNGDVLPTLLVDGRVAGVWRPVDDGIEASAFHHLDETTWDGLATEADALRAFLADRQPTGYHRYDHWWRKGMPAVEVRVLAG